MQVGKGSGLRQQCSGAHVVVVVVVVVSVSGVSSDAYEFGLSVVIVVGVFDEVVTTLQEKENLIGVHTFGKSISEHRFSRSFYPKSKSFALQLLTKGQDVSAMGLILR